jgi:uncharacterized small protein (DUF1192 family)
MPGVVDEIEKLNAENNKLHAQRFEAWLNHDDEKVAELKAEIEKLKVRLEKAMAKLEKLKAVVGAIVAALAANALAQAENPDATNEQVVSALMWDIFSLLDPGFVASLGEGAWEATKQTGEWLTHWVQLKFPVLDDERKIFIQIYGPNEEERWKKLELDFDFFK